MQRFAPVFGPKLTSALADAERGGREELIPVLDKPEADEAREMVSAFDVYLSTGSPPDETNRMLTKLSVIYPQSAVAKGSEAEARALLGTYCELLADIPGPILGRAIKSIGQTSRFFPSVAEIREAAAPELNALRWRRFTLARMVAKHEREWQAPKDLCPPEEAARIVAEVHAQMGVKPEDPGREERRERSKRRAGEK
jgi:hypothetical protein